MALRTPNKRVAIKKPTRKSGTSAAAPRKRVLVKNASKPSPAKDAIALLRADHTLMSTLFADYEEARTSKRKKALVSSICEELSVHAQVEEEIFYPAVKKALKDKELVPEATVEHATLKDLIAQVEGEEPSGEMFDAKIKVMSEYVKHHVKEEQEEMFPKARKTKLDMTALGLQMATRKEELKAQKLGKPAGFLSQLVGHIAIG